MTEEIVPVPAEPRKRRRTRPKLVDATSARWKAVTLRSNATPASALKGYQRAAEGSASPSGAIKAFCLQCVCYDRSAVTDCSALACPQWAYRPFQAR